jgi:hypothetical protein
MRTEIKYEWSYETVDSDGDIVESIFWDTLESFFDNDRTNVLCLIRNEGNEIEGLTDRYWAYVENGILPNNFSNSIGIVDIKVPKKFHKEYEIFKNKFGKE